jgi:putative cardiolipin synthase
LQTEDPPMQSMPASSESGLGHELAPVLAEHPGQSAFGLLQHGPAALLARAVLADLATSTIDVQYYIYEDDFTGILLMQKLLQAADRGVLVRILLDDNNLRRSDEDLRLLTAHPNIEIRVVNPYRVRARWLRPVELLFRFSQLQRRMHNKIFTVDGTAGIFGGRNIGDNYFNAHRSANFADFDVFVAGELISEANGSFEAYWIHRLAIPIEKLAPGHATAAELAAARRRLNERLAQVEDVEDRYDRARAHLVDILEDPGESLIFSAAEFVADSPDKLEPSYPGSSPVLERLQALWEESRSEALIESAYFVPHRRSARFIRSQAQAGVRTRLLTNSLAANDVTPVHAGYAKYRRRLLKAGIELFEFRRQAEGGRGRMALSGSPSGASLHAKVAVFDRKITWVGSFNLDPRSAELNSELAIVIHSEQLSAQAAGMIERDLEPDRAWALELAPRASGGSQIVWRGLRDDRMIRLSREPDATPMQRAIVGVLKFFPSIDRLL